MRRFSRITVLLVGFLALQFNALGGGVACLLSAAPAHADVVHPDMSEMNMVSTGAIPARSQPPCQQSSAPHTSCQSMTSCAAAFAITPAQGVTSNISAGVARIAMAEVIPVSRSLSPELPPPKA